MADFPFPLSTSSSQPTVCKLIILSYKKVPDCMSKFQPLYMYGKPWNYDLWELTIHASMWNRNQYQSSQFILIKKNNKNLTKQALRSK